MNKDSKRILIIAGPNGAGKTTFAKEFLPNEANCPTFVNADLIAAGLSPFNQNLADFRAGRWMVEQIRELARKQQDFAFETTLSSRRYARLIPQWRGGGYQVKLLFLRLPTPEAAIERVARRVSEQGHNVPEPVIRRRFHAGWRKFREVYQKLVDEWAVYDNSDLVPRLIEEGSNR